MPLFIRSLSGIRNYSLFTKKDVTAFCEGGTTSVSIVDALAGASNVGAEDITFYETVTLECAPRRTFHLKAVGDCNAVHAIADYIIANDIKSACVFVDRDWREFDGTMKKDARAIYTPDYAWENMVVRPELIAETILSIGHLPRAHLQPAIAAAKSYLAEVQHALRLPLYMDITGIGSGTSFFEKNERCGGALRLSDNGAVSIDRKILRTRFARERGAYRKSVALKISEAAKWKHIPGHVLMGAAINIVQGYLLRAGLKKQSKSAIRSAMLQQFRQIFSVKQWKIEHNYYRIVLSKISVI